MNSHKVRSWIYAVLLATGSVLLFVGGPDYYSDRLVKHVWDTGHIIYFALLAGLLIRWRVVARMSLVRQWAGILIVTLLLGAAIELMQNGTSHTPEIGDVVRDITGSFIALVFGSLGPRLQPAGLRKFAQISVLVLLLIQLWPVSRDLIDEAISRHQFPVLADFETPFEIDRWEGNARFSVQAMRTPSQGKALKLVLTTDKYSGVSLKYFDGEWAPFNKLNFSLYNPDASPLKITCRIHDFQHTAGKEEYEDRFNRSFLLRQGWNHIEIELNQVKESPAHRRMDMNRITGFGLFATSLPAPRIVYLDDLRLAP